MRNRRARLDALLDAFAWAHYNAHEGTDLKRADAELATARHELVAFIEARGAWAWVSFALGVALMLYAAAGGMC